MTDLTKSLAQIGLILSLAVLGHALLQRAVPHLFRVALRRRGRTESQEELAKREATLTHVVLWVSEGLILVIVALTILSQFGIDIAPALTSLGVAGVAIGFGAQALVRDIISGLFILTEDQYRVGDVVRIATVTGTVQEINLRRTLLRDEDGVVHTVPNGEVRISSNLTRESSRVNLDIPIAYGTDLAQAQEVINRVGRELANDPVYGPMISEAPKMVRVEGFQENSILVKVQGVTRPARHWDVAGEFRGRLLIAFAEAGIGLPYSPRLDVVGEIKAPTGAETRGPMSP